MATNESNIMTSHNLLNYSGMLFNKGNTKTPFSTMIGGKSKTTQSWQYVMGQEYTSPGANSQPAITETGSLTAPTPSFVTRDQKSNVCQIYHEALQITYGKQSSMDQLSGLNIAGQAANPATELDFQVAQVMRKIGQQVEYTFINGTYQLGGYDDVAYKTRGMLSAITTNIKAASSAPLGYWLIAETLALMSNNNADTSNLVLLCNPTHIMQMNADAVMNGLTVTPAGRNENGLNITNILTPNGSIGMAESKMVPAGTALIFDPSVCSPVDMPVPGKGNFFLEPLAKVGASEKYQIYGQLGLDYGMEWLHGKITGLSTTFTPPSYNKKVWVAGGAITTTAGT